MTFSEFLRGINDHFAADLIETYQIGDDISSVKHQHLWQRLKQYFITGGLPEIVTIFAEEQADIYQAALAVRNKQSQLIQAYYADIAKHSGKVNAMHIDRTWQAIPAQLASNYDTSTSRFKFKGGLPVQSRYRQLAHVIDWLSAAELIIRLPIVNAFEHPISAYTKENLFKLMIFDIGLLGAMSGIDPKLIINYDYGTYKGYFAENFVGQQLNARHQHRLFCWQEHRSEIEFLSTHQDNIIPIEVKSGKVIRNKSLQKYSNKYHPKYSIILSANPPNNNQQPNIIRLPLYLAEKINQILPES